MQNGHSAAWCSGEVMAIISKFLVDTAKCNIIYYQVTVKKCQIIAIQTKYASVMLIVCWLLMYNPTFAKNYWLVGYFNIQHLASKYTITACWAKVKFKVSVWM